MLHLPNVTLVIAETRAHALAARTINDLVSRVKFGDILIYSDKLIDVPGACSIAVKDWSDKFLSGHFYYTQAAEPIKTSHALLMEWDAGLNKPEVWTDDFLQYDFIGAPWPGRGHSRVRNGQNVGNGGFMLLSKQMIDYLYRTRSRFKIATDYHLACEYRTEIEREGNFKWAKDDVAVKFSFEGWDYGPTELHVAPDSFGYHGVFNWHAVLNREELIERAKLVKENPFTHTTKLHSLLLSAPWLAAELKMGLPQNRGISQIDLLRQRRGLARRRLIEPRGRGIKA